MRSATTSGTAGDAHQLIARVRAAGAGVLVGELATIDVLTDRVLRRRLLRQVAGAGQVEDTVSVLARYLPAALEADPAGGRWVAPDPAELLVDLWSASTRAGVTPNDDLRDQLLLVARTAPHRLTPPLLDLVARSPQAPTWPKSPTLDTLRAGLRRHRRLLAAARAPGAGTLQLPPDLAWVDDIVTALVRNHSAGPAWVAGIVAGADTVSVNRSVARLCWHGELGALTRLLCTPSELWDLDMIATHVLERHGPAAFEQLIAQVEQAVAGDLITRRRLQHLLEGVAGDPILDLRFWAGRPVQALHGELLTPQLERALNGSDDPEAVEVASRLAPVWGGTVTALHDAVSHLLGDAERAPAHVAGTVAPWNSP
jgi:hypothetical protein